MSAVDANMVLVAKGRDRDIDPLCAFLGRLGLRKLDRPTRIAVLLAQFRGLGFLILGDAAFLDRLLLGLGVALLWRGDDRGVDDLPAHGEETGLGQRRVKTLE
jgi:hypothetical protein